MGPIIFDIAGLELTMEDREILQHPLIGGVILFSRNFKNISQLMALIKDIRVSSRERLLLAVDHEGGRVQRFQEGFTIVPAAQSFAMVLDESEIQKAAGMAGWLIATELTSLDIDISFAPVLDLGHACPAIGDRAFHSDPKVVFKIANAMIDGFHQGA